MACCKFEVLGSSRVVELASGCRLPKHHNTVFQQYCGGSAGGYSSMHNTVFQQYCGGAGGGYSSTTQFFSSVVEPAADGYSSTTQFFCSIVEAAPAPQHSLSAVL